MSFFHTDVLRYMLHMRYKEETLFLPACGVPQGSTVGSLIFSIYMPSLVMSSTTLMRNSHFHVD